MRGQLYYLKMEIKLWQRVLKRYNYARARKHLPDADIYPENFEEKVSGLLSIAEKRSEETLRRIKSIDDPIMSDIFYYRSMYLMTWNAIAAEIGGNNSENSVKKMYSRYIKKQADEEQCQY